MALTFNQSAGSAKKSEINSFKFVNGDNTLRVVGNIIPRYVYWIEGENKKNIPLECLSFDRDKEAFINREKDWIKVFFPDLKCGWSYVTQCVVPDKDAECGYKVQIVNLKKKLWEQVITAAATLGDPTDIKTGWDIEIDRKKTGALAFNVEYQLKALECKIRPLCDGELEAIKDLKSMDEVMPRPTPDAQKELLDRLTGASKENQDDEAIEAALKVTG
jgi:hypothetical protein